MPLIVANLIDSGRVYYQLKDLPLEQIHPNARLAAVAARCAGDQNAYWEMHDTLFGSQIEWSDLSSLEATDTFSAYAGELGINRESFLSCLNSGSKDAAIDENISEARMIGVDSTPYFFVDGFPLNGARPYDHFDFAVSLAEEGQLAEAYAPSEPEPQGPVEIPTDSAYALGDENAPITIIEYTDYQCPFCSRHFKETYPLLLQDYVETGIVRYVLKDFPLTNIHPQAMLAAEAARCAGDQGAFFEMHDVLFDQQQKWGVSDPTELFVGYASDIGIDADQLRVCLENGDHVEAIAADLQEGIAFGVTGTPAFFLNGHLLSGAQPFAVFEQAIASLLDE